MFDSLDSETRAKVLPLVLFVFHCQHISFRLPSVNYYSLKITVNRKCDLDLSRRSAILFMTLLVYFLALTFKRLKLKNKLSSFNQHCIQ